jgi:uncharacterized membrane protein YeaQ/YmgE (transglycosylase-associated protein family)
MLDFIGFVIVGGIAGWLAGKIMTGRGFGPLFDVLVGIAGGIVGGWILGAILGTIGHNKPQGLIAEFLISLVGACLLVGVFHLIRREPIRPT